MSPSDDDDVPLTSHHLKKGQFAGANRSGSLNMIAKRINLDNVSYPDSDESRVSLKSESIQEMEIDEPQINGIQVNGTKRKSRSILVTLREEAESADEDEEPLIKRRRTTSRVEVAAPTPDSDSDDVPLVSRKVSTKRKTAVSQKPKVEETSDGEFSDSDVPLSVTLKNRKVRVKNEDAKASRKVEKKAKPPPKKRIKKEENSDEGLALAKPKRVNGTRAKARKANGVKKEGVPNGDDDSLLAHKAQTKSLGKTKVKSETSSSSSSVRKAKGRAVKNGETEEDLEAEEEEDEYHWWENPNTGDGSIKWTTLEHNGVVFPPPYELLPKNVKMLYGGVAVTLEPEAEEVAGFFGSMLNSTHNVENPTFQQNFFSDFQAILKKTGGAKDKNGSTVQIKEFSQCDFTQIFEYYDAKRLEKKALPASEKKQLKAEKDAAEAPYMFCMWDGRKQKVGNFRVEPPGLFRGRGEHPKTGRVKTRVQPEQIIINIGKDAKVPEPPEGHQWKEIKHDQTGTWLAMWQENINGAYKYVMLAANSDIKGQSDFKKFEKARELKKHIDRIRADYRNELKDGLMANRQRATAVYLIDQFALRAGNEKGDDEADTVGCCSLKYEHVTLKPPNKVIFDFLGKDSIRFYDEVEVDPQVFKNLKIFKKLPKKDGDEIFDRLSTTSLNKHLSSYMAGLTAKVFRTYNASYTMSKLLKDMKSTGSIAEKVKDYNDANRRVAILCNHKRTVAAGHAGQMEKLGDKIKGLKYQKWRVRQMMLAVDPKIKRKKGAEWFKLDEDLDEEWVKEHQVFLVEELRQKIEKKFSRENEKLVLEGEKEMKAKVLQERLEVVKELETKFKKENKTKKVEPEGKGPSIEKYEANLAKLDQRIQNMELQAEDKENNKENYIDPRLTVVFSKKFEVPIEKFFSKTLREKFEWAIKSVDENWEF